MSDWKAADAAYAQDYAERMDALTPEPLFESFLLPSDKVCLRCGQVHATSVLYAAMPMRPVLPLCPACAADWNVHGYRMLKSLNPKKLLWRLTLFKLTHPFGQPSIQEIIADLKSFFHWAKKMQRLRDKSE
jgi:hypothetical protein